MEFTELAIRLGTAALCGGVIGFEREQQQKPAGLRTHMLVAIGSAAFTMAALSLDQESDGKAEGSQLIVDPARVIQGIAGGIGFLGAGAIIRAKESGSVRGLTTAATIWVVGAVGICCGVGNYKLAVATTVLVVLIASILGMIEGWLFAHKPHPVTGKVEKLAESEAGFESDSDDQPAGPPPGS